MRISRGAATQQTRLQGDKSQVGLIPIAANLAKPQQALVDLDDGRCIEVSGLRLAGGTYVGGNRIGGDRRLRNRTPFFNRRFGFPGTSPWPPWLCSIH